MKTKNNLTALRSLMHNKGIDAYIVTSGDSHNNSYLPDYWSALKWITGFTGSSGTFVITAEKAGLWTDSRYTIQAKLELDGSGIELFDTNAGHSALSFLVDNLPKSGKLGFDGRVVSLASFKYINDLLKSKKITYAFNDDLIGEIWHNRPALSVKPAFEHTLFFAGKSAADKLDDVRAKMKEKNITAYLIPKLDDVAWLLNIRGYDLPNTPVVYAYVLITDKDAFVFINPATASGISDTLTSQGFTLCDYNDLLHHLSNIKTENLLFNPYFTNVLVAESIPSAFKVEKDYEDEYYKDIIMFIKTIKTNEEQANIKNAFINESVVMVKTLKWLDEEVSKVSLGSDLLINEDDVAHVIDKYRSELPNYLCNSFPITSAYGANAAQTHYKHIGSGAKLKREGFYLIDTGGQYLDGTTDTTRTIALGEPTKEMKHDYTLVLKSHIALANAVYISGTTGHMLESLAKTPLAEEGEDYTHGTGHGIGYCLNVHEAPHNISSYQTKLPIILYPGSMTSIEPGIYKEGKYGIRIENIYLVIEKQKTASGIFNAFEYLTYCPIDLRAVDKSMLTDVEYNWLNNYHKCTYELLAPHLTEGERIWLKDATQHINSN